MPLTVCAFLSPPSRDRCNHSNLISVVAFLERTSAGVRPTNGGHALAERAKTLLADYDSTVAEVRRLNRGESERLRIGYIAAAIKEYLGPGLPVLRRTYPRLKVKMLDQTPGEMIIALRQDKIDLALTLHGMRHP